MRHARCFAREVWAPRALGARKSLGANARATGLISCRISDAADAPEASAGRSAAKRSLAVGPVRAPCCGFGSRGGLSPPTHATHTQTRAHLGSWCSGASEAPAGRPATAAFCCLLPLCCQARSSAAPLEFWRAGPKRRNARGPSLREPNTPQ